jgi:hypothetical protein
MTYSGLVSEYMWSKKAKIKDNFFFKQKILFKFFKWGRPVVFSLFMFFSNNFCVHIYMYIKRSQIICYFKCILKIIVFYNIISLYYEHFSTFLNFSMTKCHHNKTIFIPFDVDKDSTQESKKKI